MKLKMLLWTLQNGNIWKMTTKCIFHDVWQVLTVLSKSKLCLGAVTWQSLGLSCQWPRCQHQQYTLLCSRSLLNTTAQASNNASNNTSPLHSQISHHQGHHLLTQITQCLKSQTLHCWCQLIYLIWMFLLTYLYILTIHILHLVLIPIAWFQYRISRWNTI